MRARSRRWLPLTAPLLVLVLSLAAPATAARAAGPGTVAANPGSAPPGGTTTVTGSGWPPGTLLTVLLCGQNAISGTDSCAETSERAVAPAANGTFTVRLPVVAPPKPCPCVIHIASVTGTDLVLDTPFPVLGVADVPIAPQPAKLLALTAELDGADGPMSWFGAPAHRELRVLVANFGSSAVTDPVFRLGVSHGVFAPAWQQVQWTGTIGPGARQEVAVPVDYAFAAHGRYTAELDYAGRQLATRQNALPRPWGVALFWALLYLVVPVALFRLGLYLLARRHPFPVAAPVEPPYLPLPWFPPGTVRLPVHPTPSKGN